MTKGGFRTRRVATEVRACWRVLRGIVYPIRHPWVIGHYLREQWASAHHWNARADWARLCPHPPEFRDSSWMNPQHIECKRCERPIHFPVPRRGLLMFEGWKDGIVPEEPNACTCTRTVGIGMEDPDWHSHECPKLWMNDDGTIRAEPLPDPKPRRPGVSIDFTPVAEQRYRPGGVGG